MSVMVSESLMDCLSFLLIDQCVDAILDHRVMSKQAHRNLNMINAVEPESYV